MLDSSKGISVTIPPTILCEWCGIEEDPDVELPEDPAGDGVVTPEPEDAPDVELPEDPEE